MSEETKTTVNETEAEQAEQLDTQPEENGDKSSAGSARTFTQDEVNHIVKDRLQRARESWEQKRDDHSSAKAAELEARENRLTCKEYLLESGYPQQLLDILDTSDPETFKSKAEEAAKAFRPNRGNSGVSHRYMCGETRRSDDAALLAAFGDTKHKPKDAFFR